MFFCVIPLFGYAAHNAFSSCLVVLGSKSELIALHKLSSLCHVTVSLLCLILAVPCVGLQCVTVVFPCHPHLLLYVDYETLCLML